MSTWVNNYPQTRNRKELPQNVKKKSTYQKPTANMTFNNKISHSLP